MARECTEIRDIEKRAKALSRWLTENAPACRTEQKHLEEGSSELVYWHYGYSVALRDALRLLSGEVAPNQRIHTPGTHGQSPLA